MKSSIKFWRCPAQLLERKQTLTKVVGEASCLQEIHGTFQFGGVKIQNLNCVSAGECGELSVVSFQCLPFWYFATLFK